MEALRLLAEILGGVKINSETTVIDNNGSGFIIAESDDSDKIMKKISQKAKQVGEAKFEGDACKITMEIEFEIQK